MMFPCSEEIYVSISIHREGDTYSFGTKCLSLIHQLPFAEERIHLYFYKNISASQQTFALPKYYFIFRVQVHKRKTKSNGRVTWRQVQGKDVIKQNTSWGKYILGTILLKFDPRHSNNVERLIFMQVIKSIYNSVYFRRIKSWWIFLMMGMITIQFYLNS